jgi:hypothetical protein
MWLHRCAWLTANQLEDLSQQLAFDAGWGELAHDPGCRLFASTVTQTIHDMAPGNGFLFLP